MTMSIIMIDWFLKIVGKTTQRIHLWCWKWQTHRKYYDKKEK